MKSQSLKAWVAGYLLVLVSSVSNAHIINPVDDDGRWGFEIGNGRKLVQNLAGNYGINVPDWWESYVYDAFTAISPKFKGGGRSKNSIMINVIGSYGVTSPGQLMALKEEGDWSRIELNNLEGIKREVRKGNEEEYRKVAIELCRGKELILINLEGRLENDPSDPFNQLYESLQTISLD